MKNIGLGTFLLALMAAAACKSASSNSANSFDTSNSEQSVSALSGAITSGDNLGVASMTPKDRSMITAFTRAFSHTFESRAEAATCTANLFTSAPSCGAGVTTAVTLSSCSPTSSPNVSWNGTLSLAFSSNTACGNALSGGILSLGNNASVVLTSGAGVVRTAASGAYVELDSNASGWSTYVGGGMTVACGGSGCTSSRTITINGEHRALWSAGKNLFDHTLTTPTPLSVSGTGASMQVTAGAIQLQHNLARFIQTSTITQTLTFSAGCCWPTGGAISTTFTGRAGSITENTTFSSTCGSVSVNGTTLSLTHCI